MRASSRSLAASLLVVGICRASLLGLLVPGAALAKLGEARQPSVVARTSATGGLAIEARTSELQVTEDDAGTVTVTVPLARLDTGIALRNRHLREKYLETAAYPSAELSVARSALAFPVDGQTVSRTAPGTMKLHGVRRPVTFSYSAHRDGASSRVQGTVRLDIRDYGIVTPEFLLVKVNPIVDVSADFVATDS